VAPHRPENFFIHFDYPEQCDSVLRAGSISIGLASFAIQLWRLDTGARPANWFFHVKIIVERLPLHSWSAEGLGRSSMMSMCSTTWKLNPSNRRALGYSAFTPRW
jgi:hypothetical protein